MKLVLIADTHGYHRQLTIPPCDLILHAGDISMYGEDFILNDFNTWAGELDAPMVAIAGNHDRTLEPSAVWAKASMPNLTYLDREATEVAGLKIYGSPMAPRVGSWAFGYDSWIADRVWMGIPECDIVITHGPPRGILDMGLSGQRLGCSALRDAIKQRAPRLHVFGHIHEAAGLWHEGHTTYVNASICGFPEYGELGRPVEIEI